MWPSLRAGSEIPTQKGVGRFPRRHKTGSDTALVAGETASIIASGNVTHPAAVDVADMMAWWQHRLVFRKQTLADIAFEFNRYNRKPQIRVEGEALQARQFNGVFDADDPYWNRWCGSWSYRRVCATINRIPAPVRTSVRVLVHDTNSVANKVAVEAVSILMVQLPVKNDCLWTPWNTWTRHRTHTSAASDFPFSRLSPGATYYGRENPSRDVATHWLTCSRNLCHRVYCSTFVESGSSWPLSQKSNQSTNISW